MVEVRRLIAREAQARGMSMTQLAKAAGMARSSLYKLLDGGVADPSVSTVHRLATALGIAPMLLFRSFIALKGGTHQSVSKTSVVQSTRNSGDAVAFTADVTVPDHSAAVPGESFLKCWEIQNVGRIPWSRRRLVRVDEDLVVARRVGNRLDPILASHLDSAARAIEVPFTAPGMPCRVSMEFVAPQENCSVASLWRMQDSHGRWCFPPTFFLQVIVTVIGE